MAFVTITLAYQDPKIIRKSMAQLFKTSVCSPEEHRHIVVDQHWPIDRGHMLKLLSDLKDFGCEILDPGQNLGLHKGFNFALKSCDEDIIIGYDGDSYPIESGWDRAMLNVMEADPTVGWCSLWNHGSHLEFPTKIDHEEVIGGTSCIVVSQPALNSICAWRNDWLKKIGGLSEPNEWYGGLEVSMWPALKEHNLKWVFLRSYSEDKRFQPEELRAYIVYKYRHALEQSIKISFDEWVHTPEAQSEFPVLKTLLLP